MPSRWTFQIVEEFDDSYYRKVKGYANNSSGKKYDDNGEVIPQNEDWKTNEKAQSAQIFYEYYAKAKDDKKYLELKQLHKTNVE